MRRRVLFWIALLAAAGLVVLLISRQEESTRPQPVAAPPEAATPEITPTGREIATEKVPRRERDPGAAAVVAPDRDMDAREVYANFLELARFPPLSRPLDAGQHDLLHPYARYESAMMITEPKGYVRPAPEDSYYGIFTADRYALVADDTATLRFKVWKGEPEGPGVPVTIDGASVVAVAAGGEDEVGSVTLAQIDDGKGVAYRGVLDLAALGASRAGEYRVDLFFRGPDGEAVGGRLDFLYTPAAAVPATFTGKYRDGIQDGSLVVSVQVDVSREGKYDFNANLVDKDGGPVGWSRAIVELRPGKHWVDLSYFGLIFHEKKASGWFELAELRGHRMMPGETPDRELMPPPGKRHRTASYTLADFSSAEWDSPEKQEQIDMYERLIKEQDEGIERP